MTLKKLCSSFTASKCSFIKSVSWNELLSILMIFTLVYGALLIESVYAHDELMISTNDGSIHTFIFDDAIYNADGTSTWCYLVTSGTKPSLSHWVLELCPDAIIIGVTENGEPLSEEDEEYEDTRESGDPSTKVKGIKFDVGYEDGESRTVCIILDKHYSKVDNSLIIGVKDGDGSTTSEPDKITGPSCDEVEDEPGIEIAKELTSENPTIVGSFVVYDIVVTNTGDTTLTDVDVTDVYDTAYLDFIFATPADPVEAPAGTLTWQDIEAYAPGGDGFDPSESITITVTFLAITPTPEENEECYETVWQIGDVEDVNVDAGWLENYADEFNWGDPAGPTTAGPSLTDETPAFTSPFIVGTTPTDEFPYNSNKNKGYATDFTVQWNGALTSGGRLVISWSPGKSFPTETKVVSGDGISSTTIQAIGEDKPGEGWFLDAYPLAEHTITVDPLSEGTHTIRFQHTAGDGTFWDWIRLEKPCIADNCASVTAEDQTVSDGPVCDDVEINNPGIEITKELTSEDPTTVGSNVVFEINIENTGDVVLSDVDVTDTYDTAYLDFVSANPTETSNDETLGEIFWDNIESNAPGGTFDPGETITITLTFTATATTPEQSKAENCVTVTTEYTAYKLYGIISDYLVTIDESTGDATEVAMLSGSQDLVSAIAFDSNSKTLYGLARYGGTRTPHLVTIDPCTGIVTLIGQITLPGATVYFAEGLAIDTRGTIYVSMSIDGDVSGGDYYSETLATVNPVTAVATSIDTISPTVQTEADGLEFVGTTLYATDDPGSGPTNIYTIDTGTAAATFKGTLSSPRFNNVNDMAYNPDSTLLYGFDPGAFTNGNPRHLCTINHPGTATATDIGEIHTAAEFNGGSTRGIAWIIIDCSKVCDDVEIGEEIQEVEYDFGDAPDPVLSTTGEYPTLLANNGARHIITDLWLGDNIDAESDGQQSSLADGDDNNPAIGPNDEDGVTFLGAGSPGGPYVKPYQAGKNGAVEIKVSGTFTTAYIFGWVDWNQDGDWDDADEDLFGGGYLVTTTGLHTIDFTVPADAKPGNTYGRFRLIEGSIVEVTNRQIEEQVTFVDFSISNNVSKSLRSVQDSNGITLEPTGEADSGEVEDYLVDPETNVPSEKPPDPGPGDPIRATVGGYVIPVNKLSLISPYLLILGLITCALAMLKLKFRSKD